MMRETGFATSTNIFFHAVAGQGDAENVPLRAQGPEKIVADAIG